MKKVIVFTAVIWGVLFFIFQSCNTGDKLVQFIEPPFEDIFIPMKNFTIEPASGGTILTETGTEIIIPPECLVYEDGRPVDKTVNIEFREYHNAAGIILSGIPMVFDSAGIPKQFESAGMFEIRGNCEGKPVFVKEGSEIAVNLASYSGDDGYNFYGYDEKVNNWQYEGNAPVTENIRKKQLLENIKSKYPTVIEPRKTDENSIILDFDVNYNEFPELAVFHGVLWEYAGNSPASNPKLNMWIYSTDWSDIELKQSDLTGNLYTLELKNQTTAFTTTVSPVFTGKDYEKALQKFNEQMIAYKDVLEERRNEEELANAQAGFLRSFAVNGFGIYNWDRYYKVLDCVRLIADFTYEGKSIREYKEAMVFLITGSDNVVIRYHPCDYANFSFSPADVNKIIAILPGKKVVGYTPEKFGKIDLDMLRSMEKPAFTFDLALIGENVSSETEFMKMVVGL
ncbi:MAG: hypothetical protein ABIJ16_09215 [Bacteroidota bacterium]